MNTEKLIKDYKIALNSDYATLKNALLTIYNLQTQEEKEVQTTLENNGIGFSGADAGKLTYYAQYILSGKTLNGLFLEDCIKRMGKYSRQLLKVSGVLK